MTQEEFKARAMKKASRRFKNFDKDKNGVLSQEEAAEAGAAIELENKDQKEDQLRRMAWIAMISMLVCTIAVFIPFIPDERIKVIEAIVQTFFIAQAGVVATFFGANAYMTRVASSPTQTDP